jgi:hypothetical protein
MPSKLPVRVFLGGLATTCALGFIVLAGGDFDDASGKLLLSAVSVAVASLLAVASVHAWSQPKARGLARVCLAATGLALVGLFHAMWTHRPSETSTQAMLTAITLAIGTAHMILVAQGRLAPRYRWTWPATLACDALIMVLAAAAIWGDHESDPPLGLFAALLVVASGLTIAVMVFHVLGREPARGHGEGSADVCFCPACGRALWFPAGEIRCHHCDKAFFIEVREAVVPPEAVARVVAG